MKDETLEGWGEPVKLNQIRMDLNGQLGHVIALNVESVVIARSDRQVEFIPIADLEILGETTFSLGDL